MEQIISGTIGLFLLFCAVFDVEWFLRLTRSARSGYSMGRMFTRILLGWVGFMLILMAVVGF